MKRRAFMDTPAASAWPLNSLLFVPAHRVDWIDKALRTGVDGVVLDLEDSVPVERKAHARASIATSVAKLRQAGVAAIVRLNPLGSETEGEVASVVCEGLTAVMLPKASSAAEIRALHDMLSYREGCCGIERCSVAILPLPETAEGLADARQLAQASERVAGIVSSISGPVSGDIAEAFGFNASLEGLEQLYMNSKLVLDSRAGGAPFPICGVFGVPQTDLEAVSAMIRRARDLGYTGVPVMHPTHVQCVRDAFRPTEAQYTDALGLLEAFANAERQGQAAVSYRGSMIDYAMLPKARQIIARYLRYLEGRKPSGPAPSEQTN